MTKSKKSKPTSLVTSPKYPFSPSSLEKLETSTQLLQDIFHAASRFIDCTILEGHREEAEQEGAFESGASKKHWPYGTHNKKPSTAVDAAPYPVCWDETPKNLKRFYYFAGIVKGIAFLMGIPIRWGGDWDSDNDLNDQTFNDLVHFEIKK